MAIQVIIIAVWFLKSAELHAHFATIRAHSGNADSLRFSAKCIESKFSAKSCRFATCWEVVA
jgi:hypothetical protein